jgi:hypothetical protein
MNMIANRSKTKGSVITYQDPPSNPRTNKDLPHNVKYWSAGHGVNTSEVDEGRRVLPCRSNILLLLGLVAVDDEWISLWLFASELLIAWGCTRSKGRANQAEKGLGQAFLAQFSPIFCVRASCAILNLHPSACWPLTLFSPQFRQGYLSRNLLHLLFRSVEFYSFTLWYLGHLESC